MFKGYSPAPIGMLAMSKFHFLLLDLLPKLLRTRDSIPAAVEILGGPTIQHMPAQPTMDTYSELREKLNSWWCGTTTKRPAESSIVAN